jgi:hypothetical protein
MRDGDLSAAREAESSRFSFLPLRCEGRYQLSNLSPLMSFECSRHFASLQGAGL